MTSVLSFSSFALQTTSPSRGLYDHGTSGGPVSSWRLKNQWVYPFSTFVLNTLTLNVSQCNFLLIFLTKYCDDFICRAGKAPTT